MSTKSKNLRRFYETRSLNPYTLSPKPWQDIKKGETVVPYGGCYWDNDQMSTKGRKVRLDGPLGEFFNRELYRTVQFTIRERLLRSNEKQFQRGLVFKARRFFVSLNSRPRVIKKKKKTGRKVRLARTERRLPRLSTNRMHTGDCSWYKSCPVQSAVGGVSSGV